MPKPKSAILPLLCTRILCAAIFHDGPTDTLVVDNYPEAMPCTPRTLLRVDRFNGWGKVSVDESGQTVTVGCNLQIGLNTGANAYFQIGDRDRPNETLVVHGHVTIHPFHVRGVDRWPGAPRVIRLTLGDPHHPAVKPTLKIASAPGGAHGLYINRVPLPDGTFKFADNWTTGGQLHVYGGTITAATQDREHAFGGVTSAGPHVFMYGDSVVFKGAVFSWFRGVATFGLQTKRASVEDTVFEHGSAAMINKGWCAKGCVFRDLNAAIQDWGGALDARLVECRFEDNVRNFKMRFRGSRVIAVDCVFGKAKTNDYFAAEYGRKGEGPAPPQLISERHLIVSVVDQDGRPVPKVQVAITCENVPTGDVLCVTSWSGKADDQGCTPSGGDSRAVLLTESRTAVGPKPLEPEVAMLSYRIEAKARGRLPAVLTGYRPMSSWETVKLILPAE